MRETFRAVRNSRRGNNKTLGRRVECEEKVFREQGGNKNMNVCRAAGLICLVSAAALAGGTPPADGRGERRAAPRRDEMHGALIERMLSTPELYGQIGLREEQARVLREAVYEIQRREIELRAELELAGLEQARLMTREEVDEDAVLQAVETAGGLRTELAKLRARKILLLRKTLDREQMQRVREMVGERLREERGASRPRNAGEDAPDGHSPRGETRGHRRGRAGGGPPFRE